MRVPARLTVRRTWVAVAAAGIALVVGAVMSDGGVASARTLGPATAITPSTHLPPASCGDEALYSSAEYTVGVTICLQVEPNYPYFPVTVRPTVRFVAGTAPLTYCRVEIVVAVGRPTDLTDGQVQRPAYRCGTSAAAGQSWRIPDQLAIHVDYGTFTGGTYTAEVTALVGSTMGPVRNITATHTATLVPVT